MNQRTTLTSLLVAAIFAGCGNNKTAETKTPSESGAAKPETAQTTATEQPANGNGITGYWKLALEAYDENRNKKLDDNERSAGFQNRYSFQFNADGSCRIMDLYKGRYEVKESGGKKTLSVYRNRVEGEESQDPPPDVYTIISQDNNELVLLENIGDHTIWVFKR